MKYTGLIETKCTCIHQDRWLSVQGCPGLPPANNIRRELGSILHNIVDPWDPC